VDIFPSLASFSSETGPSLWKGASDQPCVVSSQKESEELCTDSLAWELEFKLSSSKHELCFVKFQAESKALSRDALDLTV